MGVTAKGLRDFIVNRIKGLFALLPETDKEGTLQQINDGVVFSGHNVWMLILAILVASIGLNLNSGAVIIGAMIISPLMGPITGVGLSLSIYNMELLKKSASNLVLMTAISLAVSFLYFELSPLTVQTQELLNRTSPTFFDVFIAILGGTALIIGISRKNRSSNVLAGVAIATAIMPPICTAGYGLSVGDLGIFAGAMYLYLLNSVFIGLIVYVFAKYLHLRTKPSQIDKQVRKRNAIITIISFVAFVAPSIYGAYDVIQETVYQQSVDKFKMTFK